MSNILSPLSIQGFTFIMFVVGVGHPRTDSQLSEMMKPRSPMWEDSDLWSTTAAQWWLTELTSGGEDGPVRGERRADKSWQRQNVSLWLLSSYLTFPFH